MSRAPHLLVEVLLPLLALLALTALLGACRESAPEPISPSVDPSGVQASPQTPSPAGTLQEVPRIPTRTDENNGEKLDLPVREASPSPTQPSPTQPSLARPSPVQASPTQPLASKDLLGFHYRMAIMMAQQMGKAVRGVGSDCTAMALAVQKQLDHYPGEFPRRLKKIAAAPQDAPDRSKYGLELANTLRALYDTLETCPNAKLLLQSALSAQP